MGLDNLPEARSDPLWESNILLSWPIVAMRSITPELSREFQAEFMLR